MKRDNVMRTRSRAVRIVRAVLEFIHILKLRLQTQDPRTAVRWLHSVGVTQITGRLSLRYSQVTPHLFVGPQYRRRGKFALQRAGINATVCLREEFNDEEHGLTLTHYSYLPVADNTAPTFAQLDEGVAFIQRIIKAGGKIYVHCGSGSGRSPSLAAAYLIAEGYPLDEAVAKIKQVRPFIRILPVQIERLREYEIHRAVKPTPEPFPVWCVN
jgi:protein-tyrosine phosphatase